MTSRRPGAPRAARRPVNASGARRAVQHASPRKDLGATRSGTSAARPAGRARSVTPERGRKPAAASRPRSAAPATPAEDGPGITITRRTLVLVSLIVIALAALVPAVNNYVAQRQQLAALRAEVELQQSEVEDLRVQVEQWEDPAYVAARARERLLFAMPGETQYRLTDTSGRDVPLTEAQQAAEAAREGEWFSTLWASVEGASRLTAEDIPEDDTTDQETSE